MVEHLLDRQADIQACKDDGASALHLAALRKQTETVALLLSKSGLHINALCSLGHGHGACVC